MVNARLCEKARLAFFFASSRVPTWLKFICKIKTHRYFAAYSALKKSILRDGL